MAIEQYQENISRSYQLVIRQRGIVLTDFDLDYVTSNVKTENFT